MDQALLPIGEAIKALKNGFCITRVAWTDNFKFVAMQIPAEIPMDVVKTMQSLPKSAKQHFEHRLKRESAEPLAPPFNHMGNGFESIRYKNQAVEIHENNELWGWNPTLEDILAEDWFIY